MRVRSKLGIGSAIALLVVNAGALAQVPFSSYDAPVSTLLWDGWEIKAITVISPTRLS